MKFLVKLKKKTPTECFQLLKDVHGDNVMSCTGVFEWHKRFMEGRKEVLGDPDQVPRKSEEEIVDSALRQRPSSQRPRGEATMGKLRFLCGDVTSNSGAVFSVCGPCPGFIGDNLGRLQ
jgi:hypothetical protein